MTHESFESVSRKERTLQHPLIVGHTIPAEIPSQFITLAGREDVRPLRAHTASKELKCTAQRGTKYADQGSSCGYRFSVDCLNKSYGAEKSGGKSRDDRSAIRRICGPDGHGRSKPWTAGLNRGFGAAGKGLRANADDGSHRGHATVVDSRPKSRPERAERD